ncbi:aldo/keto reductase [Pontibacter oryzae]|uniref:Aldo/keto reductase n=1 Tax=Pontibacter oryzae TaxID=2304593 RepID=A0A399SFB3_9BACT|nr:aldo/keto reductase [Pontibacter oryzae]RIJ41841.1 aldo/keto reductase [Pontibacter oryzae]
MKYNELGKSDIKVSEIGFGCMSLGTDHAVNKALLLKALDNGINFFDTADLYQQGQNEVTLGKAFKGLREKVYLATKVGNQWRPDGSGWYWNPSKDYILAAVESSLQRLQTDYIDLYQLHGGTIDDPIEETIEAFELLKQQGKIKQYGISSIRPNVIREYSSRSAISSVMLQYSLLDRRPEETVVPLLAQNQVGILARGSLAQGLLAGKAPKAYLEHSAQNVQHAAETIHALVADKYNAAEVAIRFALQQPGITSAILGIRTENQLKDALAAAHAAPLSEEQLMALRASIPAHTYALHR